MNCARRHSTKSAIPLHLCPKKKLRQAAQSAQTSTAAAWVGPLGKRSGRAVKEPVRWAQLCTREALENAMRHERQLSEASAPPAESHMIKEHDVGVTFFSEHRALNSSELCWAFRLSRPSFGCAGNSRWRNRRQRSKEECFQSFHGPTQSPLKKQKIWLRGVWNEHTPTHPPQALCNPRLWEACRLRGPFLQRVEQKL